MFIFTNIVYKIFLDVCKQLSFIDNDVKQLPLKRLCIVHAESHFDGALARSSRYLFYHKIYAREHIIRDI